MISSEGSVLASSPFDGSSSSSSSSSKSIESIWSWIPSHNDFQQLQPGQQAMLGAGTIALSFVMGYRTGRRYGNPFQRYTEISQIPSRCIGLDAPYLRGRVVSVSDGDTFRFYHCPTRLFHSTHLPPTHKKTNRTSSSSSSSNDNTDKNSLKLSDLTLPVRICSIDTPETPKFGKPGQPFAVEAKEYLSNIIEQKMVQIQILQADQYGRAVAQVRYPPSWTLGLLPWLFGKYVDEQMLRAGLAEVYRGSGAVYGRLGKNAYESIESVAKTAEIGQWSSKNHESAAEYKARTK
jgi:micrococcal nuclease